MGSSTQTSSLSHTVTVTKGEPQDFTPWASNTLDSMYSLSPGKFLQLAIYTLT